MSLKNLIKIRKSPKSKLFGRLPITLKVTLWYTSFLLILFFVLIIFSFFIADSYASNLSERDLKKVVNNVVSGKRNYESYEEGVLLLLYDEDGNLLEGIAPSNFDENMTLSNDIASEYTNNGTEYIYYDSQVSEGRFKGYWIRGVTSINPIRNRLLLLSVSLVILCPILLIIIALGGHAIIQVAFLPVKTISRTALEIGRDFDLSKRIELDEGEDEIHQMAKAFNEMLSALEIASDHERQFTSDASHELRTPLAVILTESQYGEEHVETVEEAVASFQVISRQSKRMTKLVNQLLEISRMDRSTEIEKTNFNLSALLHSMINDYRCLAEENDLLLLDHIKPDIFIHGNMMMVQRVFDNLFSNALKFTTSTIQITLESDTSYCYVSVRDDGPGIAEEHVDKIWDRFYQSAASRSKESNPGFGLGLSIVKKIMQLHEGTVSVEHNMTSGSTFIVSFPHFSLNQ